MGDGSGLGPLDGTTIIELASFISGPFTTMMLADLGADVVKVEPPSGDPFRRFGRPRTAMSPLFANVNRGKRSVVLDLKDLAAQEELLELLRTADVVVSNWRPEVATRLGLGDDRLAGANPRLVRAYLTGVGPSGPQADRPVFDSIIQARAGMTDTQAQASQPEVATTYLADKVAALLACQAILAALLRRERSGAGDRIDVAMLDAAAYFNFPDAGANRTFLDHQPLAARNTTAAGVRPLAALDGWLVLVPVTGAQLKRSCEAIDRPELAAALSAIRSGDEMLGTFFAAAEGWTRSRTVVACVERFDAHDVPAAPCLTFDEHLADEQVRHNSLYTTSSWPEVGTVRQVRYPAVFGTWGALAPRGPAPAHSKERLP